MRNADSFDLPAAARWFATHARPILITLAAIWAVLAVGLYRGSSWATWVWPWQDTGMTYVFLASISAAVALPLAWLAVVNQPAAAADLALDAVTIGGVCALSLLVMGLSGDTGQLLKYAAGFGVSAVLGWIMFRVTSSLPVTDLTPLPRAVRGTFMITIAGLVVLGLSLMLRLDGVYPWSLPPQTSTLIGAWFLGAGGSFVFGLLRNTWIHAGTTLTGFLAYDAVQVVPYMRTLTDPAGTASQRQYGPYMEGAPPAGLAVDRTNLGAYLAILALGAAVAAYFLFINPSTRIWRHFRLWSRVPAGQVELT